MSNNINIDRNIASKINPLISSWTEDTLSNISILTDDLGFLISSCDQPPQYGIYIILGAISSALKYESDNLLPAAHAKGGK